MGERLKRMTCSKKQVCSCSIFSPIIHKAGYKFYLQDCKFISGEWLAYVGSNWFSSEQRQPILQMRVINVEYKVTITLNLEVLQFFIYISWHYCCNSTYAQRKDLFHTWSFTITIPNITETITCIEFETNKLSQWILI